MSPKRIAFIKEGGFSLINDRVREMLSREFPHYDLEVFDLLELTREHKNLLLMNGVHMARDYGKALVQRKTNYKRSFRNTSYLFQIFKLLVSELIDPARFSFSLQTGSFYDGSIPGLPHFVYTDHTIKANLSYPDFTEADLKLLYSANRIRLEAEIYLHACHIFTMSQHITRSIVEDYHRDPSQVSCIYCGPNVPIHPMGDLPDDRYAAKHILFMGFDWNRKGGPQLLQAFAEVLKRHPDAKLTIVGSKHDINLPNVKTIGKVPLPEIGRYFSEASLYCMPTRQEPFGTVFLDAAAYKLPIISSNLGALPDYISNGVNGYLVHPDDIQGLASSLNRLLDDPVLCKQMGEKNYEIVTSRYNWENTGRLLRQKIESILND